MFNFTVLSINSFKVMLFQSGYILHNTLSSSGIRLAGICWLPATLNTSKLHNPNVKLHLAAMLRSPAMENLKVNELSG